MNLLIDLGNSRLKWAVFDVVKYEIVELGAHFAEKSCLSNFFESLTRKYTIHAVWLANVNQKDYEALIYSWWQINSKANFFSIQTPKKFNNLVIDYHPVEKFGVDRFLAMLAAIQLSANAFCVIDCGTAITVDLVNARGQHLGGHILPGLDLFPKLVTDHTVGCDISRLSFGRYFELGHNTYEGIQNAALAAIIAYLNQTSHDIFKLIQGPVEFFITGGNAELLIPYLNFSLNAQPSLVLDGIQHYSLTNSKN